MTSSMGMSIRPGNKAFCIPQRNREKDLEESLNMEQADRERSSRLMSEARRRSPIDHGRRMAYGDSYDESLSARSTIAGAAFDVRRECNHRRHCHRMDHTIPERPSEHKRLKKQCEVCEELGHSRGACHDPHGEEHLLDWRDNADGNIGSPPCRRLHEEERRPGTSLPTLGRFNIHGLDMDRWCTRRNKTLHFELASLTSRHER